jgi:hypothetical protein
MGVWKQRVYNWAVYEDLNSDVLIMMSLFVEICDNVVP